MTDNLPTVNVDLSGLPATTRAQVLIELELAKLNKAADRELVIAAVAATYGLQVRKAKS